jgi:hypothetical protein
MEKKINIGTDKVPYYITYDTSKIKTKCASCGANLKYSEVRYEKMGNYCNNCSARCELRYQYMKSKGGLHRHEKKKNLKLIVKTKMDLEKMEKRGLTLWGLDLKKLEEVRIVDLFGKMIGKK